MALVTIDIGVKSIELDLHIIDVVGLGIEVEFDLPDFAEDGTAIPRVIASYADFRGGIFLEVAEEDIREMCFQALQRQCGDVLRSFKRRA